MLYNLSGHVFDNFKKTPDGIFCLRYSVNSRFSVINKHNLFSFSFPWNLICQGNMISHCKFFQNTQSLNSKDKIFFTQKNLWDNFEVGARHSMTSPYPKQNRRIREVVIYAVQSKSVYQQFYQHRTLDRSNLSAMSSVNILLGWECKDVKKILFEIEEQF